MIYVPDAGGSFSTWENQEQFTYRGRLLELCYRAEPPHGDFLYSLSLPRGELSYRLPLWVFGRSLFFFGTSSLLAESVQAGSFNDLKSVIINLSDARYARLDGWYHDPRLTEQGLLLSQLHNGAPLLLTPSLSLNWRKFDVEGAPV